MPDAAPTPYDDLGTTREDQIGTYVLLGGGGALLLTAGPVVASWLASVPFVPFTGVLEWVGGFDDPWIWWVARPVIGLLAGVVLAFLTLVDEWRLEVHDDAVVVVHDDDRRRLPKESIVGIHFDKQTVIIDGEQGRRLFDRKVEAKRSRVREAFVSRGYPVENE